MTPLECLLVLALALRAQDLAKDDPKALAAEAARSLKLAAKPGSLQFQGTLKTEVNPDEADSEATECRVSGTVGTPLVAVMTLRSEVSTHEIVYKAGKMAGRLTWKGHPLDVGKAPGELLSLVNLERLAIFAEKSAEAKALGETKVGGEDCRAIEIVPPKEAIRSHSDDAEAAQEEDKSVEKLELKLHLRKSDGFPLKLEAVVHRIYKDEDNPNDVTKGRSQYSLSFKEAPAGGVKIPPALEKLLKD